MDELTIAFKIESPPSWLPIGRTAENNWRTVEIDCSYWFNMNANGEVVLMYKPSCGMSPYPLLTERDGDNIIWRPKSGELVEGVGRLQAFFEVGTDVIGSSDMISCEVDSSLLGADPGTDPGQTDLPWALDIIEQIAELSGHYPKIIDGDLYIWDSTLNDWVEFEAGGGGAVESVNGKTGVVVLDASDVGALPDDTPIPAAVTEQTVSGWGFTKNTGTYSKPSGGIPASDLAPGVIPDVSGKANAADVAALVSRLNAIADSDDTTLDQLSEIVAYIKNNKSLIDNITTGKVSVSDIIDNLTSAETGKPLSANQGRALKALIDAIVVPTESTVSGWGFTKNTGTYSKPSGGIPKSDLASDVKTSLRKADTALQSAPVTSVNTKTGAVVLSASDVGALPSSTSIPAKASDLTNDIGYQTEQDVQAAISGVRQIPTFPSISDIAELWHSVSKLPSGAWEDYAWHQCPEAVRNYIANVDYNGVAYTESSIGTYAPTPAVPATNTKPIGQTVDGVTFYNIRPNVNAPYATENKSGVLNPLDQVRWINTAATNNFRDLGGWACDGGTVKYGLLYRSGNLGAADEDLIVNRLGITVECDLTADGEPAYPGKMRFIGYTSYAMYSLANTGAWQTNLRGIFDAVCGGESVVFHCSMGADRTGTLACILEGLLGVSQSDIDKDYELTSFYALRARNGNYQGGTTDWAHLIAQIEALDGETFRDKCVTFVKSLGFTVAEINKYRRAMIDGNPEDLAAPTVTYTVTKALTSCTTNNHSSSADGGGVYAATITADSGYTLTGATVSITMGGTDITESAYSNGAISIANVTGNIVIQISAVAESRLKELFDPSAATLNQRFNSSGGYTALNGNFCTDFIPVSGLNTSEPWRIHIKDTTDATRFQYGEQQESIAYFKADKSIMNSNYGRLAILTTSGTATVRKDDDQDGGTHIDINKTGDGNQIPSTFFDLSQVAYIRVCMMYSKNTEIPDTATLANISITADKITN